MTRAEQTLTLCQFAGANPFSASLGYVQRQVCAARHDAELDKRYFTLGMADIYLGYAGKFSPTDEIHPAIAAVNPGDPLQLSPRDGVYAILNGTGQILGKTARAFVLPGPLERCEVAAVIIRFASDSGEEFQQGLLCERWEVVVPRIVVTVSKNTASN